MKSNKLNTYFLKYNQQTLNKKQKMVNFNLKNRNKKFKKEKLLNRYGTGTVLFKIIQLFLTKDPDPDLYIRFGAGSGQQSSGSATLQKDLMKLE